MIKKLFILLAFILSVRAASAQAIDSSAVVDLYMDLNVAMLEGNSYNAERISERIMPDSAALPHKARISYYNMLGKLYEDNQPADAEKYYNRVVTAVPDYYVAHRALGYLYLKDCQAAEQKLTASPNDASLKQKYEQCVRSALPHLEKAQACDPTPETLEIIISLYKKIHDDEGLKTLYARMKDQSKTCLDVLDSM